MADRLLAMRDGAIVSATHLGGAVSSSRVLADLIDLGTER
jgi:hypothetical protein